ncbi:hypothetical protein ACMGDK_10930 [Chryseobacterium sp. DT-3]
MYSFQFFKFFKGFGGHADNPAELETRVLVEWNIIPGMVLLWN